MKTSARWATATVAGALLLVGAASEYGHTASSGDHRRCGSDADDEIHACVNEESGEIKIVGANACCGSHEKRVAWNVRKPSGIAGCQYAVSCKAIHQSDPNAPSGIYTVQPPGARTAFNVMCDMTTAGGGWTLVAREQPNSIGTDTQNGGCGFSLLDGALHFLNRDSGNPDAIAGDTGSGLIGSRFSGSYSDVWIGWNNGADYIRFTLPGSFDIFADFVNTGFDVTNFCTSDAALQGWVNAAGGAKFCHATGDATNVRPGDTSWAVKAKDDNNTGCGCNSGDWTGRGAYYGGAQANEHTSCCAWGGGWAGVRDNGQQKGSLQPPTETLIYVR